MAVHEFLMIEKNYQLEDNINEMLDRYYESNKKNYKTVSIHDDIILYILDTLNFIETIWVSGERKKGIDYLGYSVITNKEIRKLENIISSWINIFNEGDEDIILTGEFLLSDKPLEGEYEKLIINKNELIKMLKNLKDMCYTSYKENYYIIHLGI